MHKKPKTPRSGASCISKTTKQHVGHLVFTDLSLEKRFITTSQGVINLSQIYSLNSVIPNLLNSEDKAIPEIRHIYPGIELFLLSGTGLRAPVQLNVFRGSAIKRVVVPSNLLCCCCCAAIGVYHSMRFFLPSNWPRVHHVTCK